MKGFLGVVFMLLILFDPGKIGKINTLKSEAKTAFKTGDFKTAISKYKYLIDSLGVKEEEVMMNLGHAYFKAQDTLNAFNSYLPLTQSNDTRIKSLANQQLGVLANRQGKGEEALNYFKHALKAAPQNEDARFNYEMVKKKLEEKKKQDQQNKDKENKDKKDDKKKDQKDQNKDQKDKDKKEDQKDKKDQQDKKDKDDQKKDQDKKDKQDQDKKDQNKDKKDKKDKEKQEKEKQDQENKDKEKKDIPPSVSEKLKDMQMSEDKAKMILEAMKNQEMQYLQQNKRKATKPKDKGKPDW